MSKCHPSIDKQIEGVGGREGMKSQSWDLIEDKTSSRSRYVLIIIQHLYSAISIAIFNSALQFIYNN